MGIYIMKIRKVARKMFDGLGKYRLFFARGYQIYFAIFLTLFNTSVLAYNFVIIKVPFLSNIIKSFWIFTMIFLIVLISFSIIMGKFDFKRGTYRKETEVVAKYNPIWQKVYADFDYIKKALGELKEEMDELKGEITKVREESKK